MYENLIFIFAVCICSPIAKAKTVKINHNPVQCSLSDAFEVLFATIFTFGLALVSCVLDALDGAVAVMTLPLLTFSIYELAIILPFTIEELLLKSSKFPGVDSTKVIWLPVAGYKKHI